VFGSTELRSTAQTVNCATAAVREADWLATWPQPDPSEPVTSLKQWYYNGDHKMAKSYSARLTFITTTAAVVALYSGHQLQRVQHGAPSSGTNTCDTVWGYSRWSLWRLPLPVVWCHDISHKFTNILDKPATWIIYRKNWGSRFQWNASNFLQDYIT
jgi:hypothetical protein